MFPLLNVFRSGNFTGCNWKVILTEHSWKCYPISLFSFYVCYFQIIYYKWSMFAIPIQGLNSDRCAFTYYLQFFEQGFLYKASLTSVIMHSPGSNLCIWSFTSNLSWYHTHAYDLVHLCWCLCSFSFIGFICFFLPDFLLWLTFVIFL